MRFRLIDVGSPDSMQPLTCRRSIGKIPVAGTILENAIASKFSDMVKSSVKNDFILSIKNNLWLSASTISEITMASSSEIIITAADGSVSGWLSRDGEVPSGNAVKINIDKDSFIIKYPWQVLSVNEEIIGSMKENVIEGDVRPGVTIDGKIAVGEGTVVLPGVYVEGNVIIGKNCKIGPNCYLRGKTYIGNNCHVGQAVELKNSILMDHVSVGHLSYVGDSIICPSTNFGAGTITANLRHDGKNHRSDVSGELIDTGRRKFGAIFGDNVHTGIHTSIYPGRKIWPDAITKPGEIVQKDIR